MEYVIFLFYIATFMLGFSVVITAAILLARYRKKVIAHFLFLEIGLTLLVLGITIDLFQNIASFNSQRFNELILYGKLSIETLSLTIIICFTPLFFHSLFGIPVNRWLKRLFLMITLAAAIALVGYQLTRYRPLAYAIIHPALFGSITYGIILSFRNFSSVRDEVLRRVIKTIVYVTFGFLPFMIIDANPDLFSFSPINQPYVSLSVPSFFFLFNSLGIILSLRYFDQPTYLDEGKLTDHFKNSFKISDREGEIIAHLIKGLSNKEIGEKCFISFKTVENHLSNIYQKTDVRNRVELTHLINTNRTI